MTDPVGEEWRVVGPETRDGPMNMALDEVAAATAGSGGPRTVRVFGWEPSTLSLGYAQDPATIDWEHCEREGIDVTRRPTGGGAIYHDAHGDVSYSIVVPAEEVPGDLHESYERLCQPLFAALETLGVGAAFADEPRPALYEPACYLRAVDPAHDVVGPDGRKLSGNAQYRQRDAVVQHGSLTYERTTRAHCGVFDADLDPTTFDERVGAITDYVDVERSTVVTTLAETLAEWFDAGQVDGESSGPVDGARDEDAWTDEERADARALVEGKYGAASWVRDGEDPKRSAPDGTIEE